MSRLPSILLACYNSEKIGSVNHTLSKYLLENIDRLDDLNIKQLSADCFMSLSTVSRFCKSIGLNDFIELKQSFHDIEFYRDDKFQTNVDINPNYLLDISKEIINLHHDFNTDSIKEIVVDIYNYKNVAVFGSMQALTPAIYLQQELYVSRKIACCKENYKNQLAYFKETSSDDLVIIFSSVGNYFKLLFDRVNHNPLLHSPKIWVITYNQDVINFDGVDRIIHIKNDNITYMNHPLKFNLIANMIAAQYAKYCHDQETQ